MAPVSLNKNARNEWTAYEDLCLLCVCVCVCVCLCVCELKEFLSAGLNESF